MKLNAYKREWMIKNLKSNITIKNINININRVIKTTIKISLNNREIKSEIKINV